MRNVCAEYEAKGYLTCCRSGDIIKHGYYMTRNRSFLCKREAKRENCIQSEWTIVIPHVLVKEIEERLSTSKYNAWYLYGNEVGALGSEKKRWVAERMIQWEPDRYGRPSFEPAKQMNRLVDALNGRTCICILITSSVVTDPLSGYPLKLVQKSKAPNVCLIKNDGSWENVSFHINGNSYEIMATILLGEE